MPHPVDSQLGESGEGRADEPGLPLLAEPVGVALDVDAGGVVQQPVEDRARDHGVAKHLAPSSEAPVAGQQDGAAFVAPTDELEEEIGTAMGATTRRYRASTRAAPSRVRACEIPAILAGTTALTSPPSQRIPSSKHRRS